MGIDGNQLIEWGFEPGKLFPRMLSIAENMQRAGHDSDTIFAKLSAYYLENQLVEVQMRTNSIPYKAFLDTETDAERDNAVKVAEHMDVLLRCPTIVAAAVMPDACPAGSKPGTIPVGGVVAAKNAIHPGFHSADICCSMAISVFKRNDDPKKVLDAVQDVTHFGPGGRSRPITPPSLSLESEFDRNPFLKGLEPYAINHFMTQGDGNHFAFIGHIESTGKLALVTHHGSRGLGAQLYNRGMTIARKNTKINAPRVPEHHAWITADSEDGQNYWKALQYIRQWTRANHFGIHSAVAGMIGNQVLYQFWNEHNFVFQKDDGLFYHGKGATPSWDDFSDDDSGFTLIPMNMSEPILITTHRNNADALEFAPHGAGRNLSRTAHALAYGETLVAEMEDMKKRGLDIRSWQGTPDFTEFPSAYKNAESVIRQIEKYKLANIVDKVLPYGSIMAGNSPNNGWRTKKNVASDSV